MSNQKNIVVRPFYLVAVLLNIFCIEPEMHAAHYTFKISQSSDTAVQSLFKEAIQLKKRRTIESRNQSIEKFQEAYRRFTAMGNRRQAARALSKIGRIYSDLGKKDEALKYFSQALDLYRAINDRTGEIYSLINLGNIYSTVGQSAKALNYFNESLHLSRGLSNQDGEIINLNSLGEVYTTILDKPQQALKYYSQGLTLSRTVSNRAQEARSLSGLGAIYARMGKKRKALEYYKLSLSLSKTVGNRTEEARSLNGLGTIYAKMGEKGKALEHYKLSLSLRQDVEHASIKVTTLHRIGKIYASLGQTEEALEYFNQSLNLSQALGRRRQKAHTLAGIARLYRNQGKLKQALETIQAATSIFDDLRSNINDPDLRASYFTAVQYYYQLQIDILMKLHQQNPNQGYAQKALETSERARARSLIDLLTESSVDLATKQNSPLIAQEHQLQESLNQVEIEHSILLNNHPTSLQIAAIEQRIVSLAQQIKDLTTRLRIDSPAYVNLKYPQPLTLEKIQRQTLDKKSILLEYHLGNEHSYLWAVTPSSITSHELPNQDEIEAASEKFRQVVSNPDAKLSEITQAGIPLTRMLLEPVAKYLGQKRLLIVGHGALQYLPFAALPSPSGNPFLLIDHEIVSLPSASTLATLRQETSGRKAAQKPVAIFADPVFSETDERFAKSGHSAKKTKTFPQNNLTKIPFVGTLRNASQDAGKNFERLPGTRQEAEDIMKLLPENTRTQTLDFAASRENVLNAKLSEYRIIHFATHGILNTTQPELSSIVLSLFDEKGRPQNGFLRLNDIFNLNLPAELVVLSACQTGLGQNMRGEGLIGLTRGFMYAGSPRVLASLWSVNDQSTAVLMTQVYEGILKRNLSPAAALREAQLQLLKHPKWNMPYHWAAFTLQGEWK